MPNRVSKRWLEQGLTENIFWLHNKTFLLSVEKCHNVDSVEMHSSWLKENVFKKIKVVARSSSLIHDCWKPVWDFFKWYTVLWINACAVSCGKTTAACSTRRYIWDSNFSNHIVLEFILKKFRIQKNVDYPLGTDVLKSCFFNITTCLYTILGTYFASNSQDFSSCFSLLLFCAFFFFLS